MMSHDVTLPNLRLQQRCKFQYMQGPVVPHVHKCYKTVLLSACCGSGPIKPYTLHNPSRKTIPMDEVSTTCMHSKFHSLWHPLLKQNLQVSPSQHNLLSYNKLQLMQAA
jgi:hypothetical protein